MKRKTILNRLYHDIEAVVLSRQHPVTGLLPASTAVNHHGNYTDAWVRDNVYSVLCVWTLAMAMRRGAEKEKADQLEQATTKLMRGLLNSMMRQANKVETFKRTLHHVDALHAKYDTATGLGVVADDAWGHLQIDATSLFLLMLAQMSASGLRIVCTFDEVDFVQNLVYYIASAYRCPDFGIWERGNKINNGKTEINASSVGMAKAALQALDNFNLFGKNASPRAVIHTVPDAISNARNTLAALLPRESLSKETDSALLSIIGFPAFAVGSKALTTKTRDDILTKLGGNCGLKRFLWDGHQTAIEEGSRLYYEHSELANFEHIESEWPLFFCYLYIHALFDGNESTAAHYRQKIESLMLEVNGQKLIPELYFVAKENIEAEKKQPKSQVRHANDNVPLVWAQSLYWVGLMLDEGLVYRDDLDPLKMRRRARTFNKTQIALVVLAENETVKQTLAENGVIAETLTDIAPINLMTAQNLVDTYTHVGANSALHLSGRPKRRLQSLATSQIYTINQKPFLCLSSIQGEKDEYVHFDAEFLAQSLERELDHICTQWWRPEVAVFTWLVEDSYCQVHNVEVLYNTLRKFQLRSGSENVGYASASLAVRASKFNGFLLPNIPPSALTELEQRTQRVDTQSWEPRLQQLLECLDFEPDRICFDTLEAFVTQFAAEAPFKGESPVEFKTLVKVLYAKAKCKGFWLTARYCYDLLGCYRQDLADGLALLTSRHLSVVIGKDKVNSVVVDSPGDAEWLFEAIHRVHFTGLERALTQEFLLIIGSLMRTAPRIFDGLRSIKIQNLITLCVMETEFDSEREMLIAVSSMPPAALFNSVSENLQRQNLAYMRGLHSGYGVKKPLDNTLVGVDTDWFEWRIARGSITTLDDDFLKAIWQSLANAHSLAFGDLGIQEHTLNCDWARSSMTPGETSFANLIDKLTNHLHPTYYKSAVLEALGAFTELCQGNPDVKFSQPVVFSQVLEQAAKSYIWDAGVCSLVKRDLDVLLEQPPAVLHGYVVQVLENHSD